MGFAEDVLNSTLVDLLPKFEETFIQSHPLIDKITKGKVKRSMLRSQQRSFTVVTRGPGAGRGIRSGSETLMSTRKSISAQGNEYAYRYIYHWLVPGKDLAESGGEQDINKIIENYPMVALAEAIQNYSRQLARGSASSGSDVEGSECDGFTTLNGDQTYDPQGLGARQGIFTFSSTQNATVHGLPMEDAASSPTTGWKHGYAHIGNFSTEGNATLRKLRRDAERNGKVVDGAGVDLFLSDDATFHNYMDFMDDKVIVIDDTKNPSAENYNREGVKFGRTDWFEETDIDITDTTSFTSGNAALGVLYGFTTSKWELIQVGNNSDKATKGNWDLVVPKGPLDNMDAWQYRIVAYQNLCCHSLRNQFAMTGGAIK